MISNRENAGLTVMDNFPEESRSVHPSNSRRECQRVIDLGGEVPYSREKFAQARAWIVANPSKFLDLTWRRFIWFFIECSTRYRYSIDWTFLLLGVSAVMSSTRLNTFGSREPADN